VVNGCGSLLTDVPTMQAGGYVPPALTLVIPGYDCLVLALVRIKNKHICYTSSRNACLRLVKITSRDGH